MQGPTKWCNPVHQNEEGILNPKEHLECYDIRDPEAQPLNRKVIVTNQFGITPLLVQTPLSLCVPTQEQQPVIR